MEVKIMKTKRMMITMIILVCCIAVVGGIYTVLQPKTTATDEVLANNEHKPVVETIETKEPVEVEEIVHEDKKLINAEEADKEETVVVEEIVITEEKEDEKEKEENVVVEVPMPEVPDTVPKTKDDVTDMSKEPEYENEQVTYQEEEKDELPKVENEEKEDSNLVPDSQNPFADPANVGKPKVYEGEDFYQDGQKAGEGDKF
jgi:hypothetical protein